MIKQRIIAGIAAYLPHVNVDTDQIVPKVHLLSGGREGLGKGLFSEWRYDAAGKERKEFVLNREPFRKASILIALENFGCGSSREHAVWALDDFGLRCVIAPSFGSIFYENALKNFFAPVIVDVFAAEQLGKLADARPGERFEVDLEQGIARGPDGSVFPLRMEDAHRQAFISGIDDIQATLMRENEITAFQALDRASRPWVYRQA